MWGDAVSLGNGATYAGGNPWTWSDPSGLYSTSGDGGGALYDPDPFDNKPWERKARPCYDEVEGAPNGPTEGASSQKPEGARGLQDLSPELRAMLNQEIAKQPSSGPTAAAVTPDPEERGILQDAKELHAAIGDEIDQGWDRNVTAPLCTGLGAGETAMEANGGPIMATEKGIRDVSEIGREGAKEGGASSGHGSLAGSCGRRKHSGRLGVLRRWAAFRTRSSRLIESAAA